MKPKQFIEQIWVGQYEAFREYLNTGENGGPVTRLDLSSKLRDIPNLPVFLKHLFVAIEPITTLTSLNLWNANIGDAGADAIANGLKTNTTLTSLNLWNANIGDDSAADIAQALKTNTTLTELQLGLNNIGNNGATAIAEALKANTTLTELYLTFNNIGNDGAAAIAQALSTNTTLTKLELLNNRIDNKGAAAIAKALEKNATLTTLDLRGNNIDGDSTTAILSQIPLESALTHLLFECGGSQNNTNDIIGTLQQENEVLDIVYRQWPRPITEAFAQHFTLIKNETAQNLLIDPNNDISRGRAYVKHRSLARKPAQEAAPNATPASNDSQNNPAKRQRLNPKDR